MSDGESLARPGMKDAWLGNPVVCQSRDLLPSHGASLTSSPQRASPELYDVRAERGERPTVGRDGVLVEVAVDDLTQPFALYRYRLVHAPLQLLFDCSQLRSHTVASAFPFK